MSNFDFKTAILPHLLAIIVFGAISYAYFNPLLQGKELTQHDKVQSKGMMQEMRQYQEETGEVTLWTNSMFGGMPTFQIWGYYPSNLLTPIIQGVKAVFIGESHLLFFLLVGAYILGLVLTGNVWLAAVGAIAYALGSFNIISIEAGHLNKVRCMALIAPILGGVILSFRGRPLLGLVLFTMALGLQIRSNHFQITYYTMLISGVIGAYYLYKAIADKDLLKSFLMPSGALLIGLILALGSSASQLWSTYEYSQYTMRGGKSDLTIKQAQQGDDGGLDKDYAFSWSYGIMESFTVIIPGFMGGASAEPLSEDSHTYKAFVEKGVPKPQAKQAIQRIPTYWGDQPFTAGPLYFGAIVCFLFILGLTVSDNKLRWAILIGAILTLFLSWGKNFSSLNYFLFDHFPMYNKFRTPSMWLSVTNVLFIMAGFLGLKQLISSDQSKKELWKKTTIAAGITGGVVLLFGLIGSYMYDFGAAADAQLAQSGYPVDAIEKDRAGMLRADSFRSILFIALAVGLIWAYLHDKLKATYFLVALGLVSLIDLWVVDSRYLNKSNYSKAKKTEQRVPTQADQQILQDKDLSYRVLDLSRNTFNTADAAYWHKNIGGYHAAKLRIYQELIENRIQAEMQKLNAGLGVDNIPVLNMLNLRYLITAPDNVVPSRNGLGNAWFINKIDVLPSADEVMTRMAKFDPRTTAFSFPKYEGDLSKGTSFSPEGSTITLTSYAPNKLEYKANSTADNFAVFSEIYYPAGWTAMINGQPTDFTRVNYVLRGMYVPKGEHNITFEFKPKSYYIGEKISLASSILIYLLLIGAIYLGLKSSGSKEKQVKA